MNPLQAFVMGLVEGITEFLPISSTAHMIIVAKILQIPQTSSTAFFEIFIQSGAILAALILYFRLLLTQKHLIERAIESFIPTALIGIFAHKYVKEYLFQSLPIIGISLIVASIVFIVIEAGIKGNKIKLSKTLDVLSRRDAILIGAVQAIALFPGVSRAGAVIVCMLMLGYTRKQSTIYSFILAIPTILAASIFDLIKSKDLIQLSDITPIAIGFVTAFISAYLVIKLFIKFTQDHTLVPFAFYRLLIAVPLLT